MSPLEEKRLRNKSRGTLLTDEAMVRVLDGFFGRDNYVYDQESDVWVAPDRYHTGLGRAFIVIERGCDWRKIVIPPVVLQ
jgi:hypothetical protein